MGVSNPIRGRVFGNQFKREGVKFPFIEPDH